MLLPDATGFTHTLQQTVLMTAAAHLEALCSAANACRQLRRRSLLLFQAAKAAEAWHAPEAAPLALRLFTLLLEDQQLSTWRSLRRVALWGQLTAATRAADAPASWHAAAALLSLIHI
jgi:hypothetical protein